MFSYLVVKHRDRNSFWSNRGMKIKIMAFVTPSSLFKFSRVSVFLIWSKQLSVFNMFFVSKFIEKYYFSLIFPGAIWPVHIWITLHYIIVKFSNWDIRVVVCYIKYKTSFCFSMNNIMWKSQKKFNYYNCKWSNFVCKICKVFKNCSII